MLLPASSMKERAIWIGSPQQGNARVQNEGDALRLQLKQWKDYTSISASDKRARAAAGSVSLTSRRIRSHSSDPPPNAAGSKLTSSDLKAEGGADIQIALLAA